MEIEESKSVPRDAAYGWRGLMSRLESVRRLVTIGACSPRTQTMGREAIDAAQAGNRVSRDPGSFVEEIFRLRSLLARLPEIVRRMRRASMQIERMQALEKAERILQTAKREFKRYFQAETRKAGKGI